MREKILTTLVVLFFFDVSLSQNLISSQKGIINSDGMIIEWAIGENYTKTIRFNTKILTEGFIQPHRKTLSLNENNWIHAVIYPNPAQSEVYVKTTSELSSTYTIFIYDSYGRIINRNLYYNKGKPLSIDVNRLPLGIYFLHIMDEQTKYSGVYKFIKN